ncbi:MAG: hypothetical protein WAN11_19425 [Syntrophobacteraceae bacterium]
MLFFPPPFSIDGFPIINNVIYSGFYFGGAQIYKSPFPVIITTAIDNILYFALTAFAIYTGTGLWKFRPRAVRNAKIFLAAVLGYTIVSFLLFLGTFYMTKYYGRYDWFSAGLKIASTPLEYLVFPMLVVVPLVTVGYLYLIRSKQIAANYITEHVQRPISIILLWSVMFMGLPSIVLWIIALSVDLKTSGGILFLLTISIITGLVCMLIDGKWSAYIYTGFITIIQIICLAGGVYNPHVMLASALSILLALISVAEMK